MASTLGSYHEVQILTTALHDNFRELGLTYRLMRHAAAEREEFFDFIVNDLIPCTNSYTASSFVQHIKVVLCGKLSKLLVTALYSCHHIHQTSARFQLCESPPPSILLWLC